MKKILFDVRELERNKKTGISRFVYTIIENSDFFDETEFILIYDQKTDLDGYNLNRFNRYSVSSVVFFSDQFEILNLIKKIKPDIYFSPYYKYPIFSNVFNIITIFDLTYLIVEAYKDSLKNSLIKKNFLKFFSSRSNLILTSSQNTLKDLVSLFGFSESKIKVIYLPVSECFYPRKKEEIERVMKKYNIKKDFILYVGNNKPHKNLDLLYKSYLSLGNDVKNKYQLVMIGFSDFQNIYSEACVIEKVNDEELACFYSATSLFVFPSLYEGFGYPPLEALKCGTRVLTSNTSSMPEILGDSVFYFNPYSKNELIVSIERILKNNLKKEIRLDFNIFSKYYFLNKLKEIFDNI